MIVGLAGRAGSGKSTVARHLASAHGFTEDAFAAPIKDAAAAVFCWDRAALDGNTAEDRAWRERVDRWWAARLNVPCLTPRWAMQHVGTELFRDGFHSDIWIASMQNRLNNATVSRLVVADVRFENEATALREAGGVVVRIVRPGLAAGAHASETQDVPCDVEVTNDGTVEELCERVVAALKL